jgi:carbamoyl-phosphate synthase large subunit
MEMIKQRKFDLVINIPKNFSAHELENGYLVRRAAVDYNIPLITNAQIAKIFISSISKYKQEDLLIKSWKEYCA